LNHTLLLAHNTLREALRDRLLTTILFFGGIFVCASIIVAPLTLGEQERVVRDLGLSAIGIFTILMIVMVGTGMVYREIERKTIYTILAQPVGRAQFILGKFLGLYGTVLFSITALSVFWVAVVALFGGGFAAYQLGAVAMLALEAMIVTAVAILFSSVSSPLLSAIFTLLVWISGHLANDMKLLASKLENPAIDWAVDALGFVLPALHHFHIRNNVLDGTPISGEQFGWCAAYTGLYCAGVLLLTVAAFARRDFE
jgi:ABC-type transport system involved in multi-copper enzyme maturation permease subunit